MCVIGSLFYIIYLECTVGINSIHYVSFSDESTFHHLSPQNHMFTGLNVHTKKYNFCAFSDINVLFFTEKYCKLQDQCTFDLMVHLWEDNISTLSNLHSYWIVFCITLSSIFFFFQIFMQLWFDEFYVNIAQAVDICSESNCWHALLFIMLWPVYHNVQPGKTQLLKLL